MSPYYTRRILTTSFINKFSLAKGKMKVSLVTQDRELEDRMLADYPGKIFGFQCDILPGLKSGASNWKPYLMMANLFFYVI